MASCIVVFLASNFWTLHMKINNVIKIEKKFEDLGTTDDFLREIENDKKDEK